MKLSFTTFEQIGIIGILGVGLAAILGSVSTNERVKRTAEKMDLSIAAVEARTPVDVQQSIVDRAIKNAVNNAVAGAVDDAVDAVRNDISKQIEASVKSAVTKQMDEITTSVSSEVSRQVANIDEFALKKKVTDEAKQLVLKKLDRSMDGLLTEFGDQLKSYKRMYDSLTDAFKPVSPYKNPNDGFTFRIGN